MIDSLKKYIQVLDSQRMEIIERENPAYELVISEVLNNALKSESSNRIAKGEVRDWLKSLLD
jgi:hypothetical protein